jgi:hypothetical protein
VFIPLIRTAEKLEARGPVTHLVCSIKIILNTAVKWGGSNPSSAFVGRGPQNNVEGLLVAVSEFDPRAVLQDCACTGFGLDHLNFIS